MERFILLWSLALSGLEFFLMGLDKHRARRAGRRVAEKTFFLLALLGGSPGAILGMYAFRHKTRHFAPSTGGGVVCLGIWHTIIIRKPRGGNNESQ